MLPVRQKGQLPNWVLGSFTAYTFDHVPVVRNYSIWDMTSPPWLIPKLFWYWSQYTFAWFCASIYWFYGHAEREILQRRVFHRTTLHAAIQRFHSPASEGAANKLATPVARRSKNDGQVATSSFDITEMNWRTAVFYHKSLTSHIDYTERIY
jgi:hypothetical protein